MKHSDQSTENDVDGDVSGTSIQAGSIEINVGAPRKRRWGKGLRYLAMSAAAVLGTSTLAMVKLVAVDEPGKPTPVAAPITTSAESVTTPPPTSTAGAPAASTVAGAARPAPAGQTPRPAPASSTPTAVTPTSTTTTTRRTTVVPANAPPPTGSGVRFSGTLKFGSFHLDLAEPRDIPGTNVWPLTPNRLHGDEGYWLAEWITDGVPGRAECAAELGKRATRDADNLIAGSRVCGKTPGGRIFRVDVAALDGTTITGQVTVWE